MIEQYYEDLTRCDIFEGLSPDEIKAFLKCVNPAIKRFKKNQIIVGLSQAADHIGVLLAGKAQVSLTDISGNTFILSTLERLDYFGENAAFAKPYTYPADVLALSPCVVMFLPKQVFVKQCPSACGFHSLISENMIKCLAEKAKLLNRRITFLKLKSPRQKTAAYILEQFNINKKNTFMLPQNRAVTAEFLNLPRPSFSRELCRLRDEGAIDFYGKAIKVVDIKKLNDCLR